ncbi:MAG: helix-turn-helix domain-containing protein [Deltaproteobacteria bacterium]|nr:helix-turn-helix domain-containing protein [Deltaproteobacteria bacterium]
MTAARDDKRAEILRLALLEGVSLRQIALKVKVSHKTVRKVLAAQPRRSSAAEAALRVRIITRTRGGRPTRPKCPRPRRSHSSRARGCPHRRSSRACRRSRRTCCLWRSTCRRLVPDR